MDQEKHKQRLRLCKGSSRSGFSLIEIAVVMTLLVIAIGGLSSAVVSSVRLSRTNEETAIANDAARQMIAEMRNVGFSTIFVSFNTNAADDPGLAGSAPGPNFPVPGLSPQADDPDGMVGEIEFPEGNLGLGVALDETRNGNLDALLGLPRDLNGDGDADDLVQNDYIALPVTVRVRWTGSAGRSVVTLRTVITE